MFNELEFRIELLQDRIKSLKRQYKSALTVIIFCIAVLIFDGYVYFHQGLSNTTLICLGVIFSNVLWFLSSLFEIEYERKSESCSLKHYQTLQESNIYVKIVEKLQKTEMLYHELNRDMQSIVNKSKTVCPESTPPKSESPVVEK